MGAATFAGSAPSTAIAQIVNGDFSAGLAGWTVDTDGGSVIVSGEVAVFQEDLTTSFTALSQDFMIPVGAESLSFDFTYATVPGGMSGGFPDAFSAFLVDPMTLSSLIPGEGLGGEYFSVDSGGVVFLSTGAALDGSAMAGTVRLDLTGVPAGAAAMQFFELLGGDDGVISTVTLDNVQIVVSCATDLNGDGGVGTADFVIFSRCWMATAPFPAGCEQADFDGNGVVGTSDFACFSDDFGKFCETIAPCSDVSGGTAPSTAAGVVLGPVAVDAPTPIEATDWRPPRITRRGR